MTVENLEAEPGQESVDSSLVLLIERIRLGGCNGHSLSNDRRGAVAEAFELLKTLSHPHICCYTDLLRIDSDLYVLVSEGYSMTLEDVIKDYAVKADIGKGDIIDVDLKDVTHQIICGIQFLHANGIPHGALALHNIFIDRGGNVKIGCYAKAYLDGVGYSDKSKTNGFDELETSKHRDGTRSHNCDRGTPFQIETDPPYACSDDTVCMPYQAPESFQDDWKTGKCSSILKADIWALGICLMQIIATVVGKAALVTRDRSFRPHPIRVGALHLFYELMRKIQCDSEVNTAKKAVTTVVKLFNMLIPTIEQKNSISAFGIDVISMLEEALSINIDDISKDADERIVNILDKLSPMDSVENASVGNRHATYSEGDKENREEDMWPKGRHIGGNHKQVQSSYINAVKDILHWFTGSKLIEDLVQFTGIDLNNGQIDIEMEKHPSVELAYYLLNIVSQCLLIDSSKRPSSLDILVMLDQGSRKRGFLKSGSSKLKPIWYGKSAEFTRSISQGHGTQIPIEYFLSRKYQRTDVHINELEKLNISIYDVFYIWRLMGNNPLDSLMVNEYQYGGKACRYSRQLIPLDNLLLKIRRADLFPMVIEHQVRPTCAYARQFSFLYQWVRIRRFEKLLSSEPCGKHQIIIESQIDVPPLLRKQVWSVMLGIDVSFNPPMSEINNHRPVDIALVKETRKLFGRFEHDLLHSERCVSLISEATHVIQEIYSLDSIPSSLYGVLAHLVLLYYDVSEICVEASRLMFDKYLKNYYIPSESFVQNDLAEFNTLLNFFDPQVSGHLRSIGAFAESFVLIWFMTLFSNSASFHQVFLLWDTLLNFPVNYVKYIAVMIISNARGVIMETTTAASAISCISAILDSINVPMLNYVTTRLYLLWNEVIFPPSSLKTKSSTSSGTAAVVTQTSDAMSVFSEANSVTEEKYDLECNSFIFNTQTYPYDRCFKVSLRQFSELLDTCVIVDLRPRESPKFGRIPNSFHVETLFQCLNKQDEEAIFSLVRETFNSTHNKTSSSDVNRLRRNEHTCMSLKALLGNKKEGFDQDLSLDSTILLAVGDGTEPEAEMRAIQRLIFEFFIPHVCYYRVNGDDWPKFYTLSKM